MMLDVTITYILGGEQKETVVSFGCATNEILGGEYDGPCAEELTKLYSGRSEEEWYDYFYANAVEMCWRHYFKHGFIPRDLNPKRFIPANHIVKAQFPDGWTLYRKAQFIYFEDS